MKFISNKEIIISKFLIWLLPFALVSGAFLADLIIVVISLFVILKYKIFFRDNNIKKIFFYYLCFYLYLIFNSLLSDNVFLSLKPATTHIRFIFFLIMFCYIFININNFKNKLLISTLIIFFTLCFDTFLEFFLGYNILGYKYNGQRVQSLFGDEWVVGSYISNLLPIIICLLFHSFKKNKTNNVYYSHFFIIFLVISLAVFTITLSGERSALFGTILYIFLLIIFTNFRFFHKIIIVICSIFIIIFSIISFKAVYERVFKETYSQLNIFSTSYKKDHQLLFETSYIIFKDHNKYIGVGLKGFRIKCQEKKYYSEFGCATHPHNFYFLFLTELGIIGFLFLVLFFLYLNIVLIQKYLNFGKNILNKVIYNNKNISIFLGIYVFIFPLKTHGNFFNNWLSILFILQLSLLFASYLNSLKNERI